MMDDHSVARAIAYFEASVDMETLRQALRSIQPRAAAGARRYAANDRAPMPAVIPGAAEPASREEAARTLREVKDFPQLQALARAIGQRIEVLRNQAATGA